MLEDRVIARRKLIGTIGIRVIIAIVAFAAGMVTSDILWKREAIEKGFAEWRIDPVTGAKWFQWRSDNGN